MMKPLLTPVLAFVAAVGAGCATAPAPQPRPAQALSADERAAIRREVYRDLLRPEHAPSVPRAPSVAEATAAIAAAATNERRHQTTASAEIPLVTTAFAQPPTPKEYLEVLAASSGYVLKDPGDALARHRRTLPVQAVTATRPLDDAAAVVSHHVPGIAIDVYPVTRLLVVREVNR